jgi:ATP-dependent metalloprotease
MVSSEGGLKIQAWRTLRTLALGFLLLSGVGALIEDRGISKGTTVFYLFTFYSFM